MYLQLALNMPEGLLSICILPENPGEGGLYEGTNFSRGTDEHRRQKWKTGRTYSVLQNFGNQGIESSS